MTVFWFWNFFGFMLPFLSPRKYYDLSPPMCKFQFDAFFTILNFLLLFCNLNPKIEKLLLGLELEFFNRKERKFERIGREERTLNFFNFKWALSKHFTDWEFLNKLPLARSNYSCIHFCVIFHMNSFPLKISPVNLSQ